MIDIDGLIGELSIASDDWAEKNGAANLQEGLLKTRLARIANSFDFSSMAARENAARASEQYEADVRSACDTRQAADSARGRLECIRTKIDLIRTESANARAAR